MRRSHKRRGSSVEQFNFHVPRDVIERLRGTHISVDCPAMSGTPACRITVKVQKATVDGSLRTRDPDVAASRRGLIFVHLNKLYTATRAGSVRLSHKDMVGLAGEVYGLIRAKFDDDPGDMDSWAAWKGFVRAAREGRIPTAPTISVDELADERADAARLFGPDLTAGINALPPSGDRAALEDRCGRLTWWVLNKHGLYVDRATRLRLLEHVADACIDAGWALKRAAGGDYTPDPKAARFPKVEAPGQKATVSLTGIFDRWKRERKPAGSTVTTWRGVVASLVAHVGHDDAARITEHDIVAWKDKRLATLSPKTGRLPDPKTINAGDLACIGRLYSYAIENRILTANPAKGIKAARGDKAGKRRLPYTNDEIAALLTHAEGEMAPYRRWLPILLATTGARVGELAQLWGDRVRIEEGVVVLRIEAAADGGSLKNEGSERTIPAHPVLIASGFLEFARTTEGPLFYGSRTQKGSPKIEEKRHASKSAANRLANWIRGLPGFDDPRKGPAHSIRHWWKSSAVRAGLADSVADRIQGHAEGSVAGRYRHHDNVGFLAGEVAKIPVPGIGVTAVVLQPVKT